MEQTSEELDEVEESLAQRLIDSRTRGKHREYPRDETGRRKLPFEIQEEREREFAEKKRREAERMREEAPRRREDYEEYKERERPSVIEVTQIATETQPAFKLPNGEVLNLYEYLTWLGNQINTIKRAVA